MGGWGAGETEAREWLEPEAGEMEAMEAGEMEAGETEAREAAASCPCSSSPPPAWSSCLRLDCKAAGVSQSRGRQRWRKGTQELK